ncbi:phage baseplate assembly protein V [Haliangium ochraceum]|uniref:Gp5/Type VI secretion system Vgr protein OB-fold domain-containing protein n=1 Tax=Haliangium ochraceum (strain DSM 14365 / JCM 11303 / SMP-2) TaxID=502025 RepID=D0LVW0_HALO1|nr:phage baseplate assembly protein V [Haliangium ochraceum]ACY14094.1 hypothetical protein Hoch_1542 [Haliangium ochraceum DSM 14365]
MDSIIQVIREIVRDELRSVRIGELGTVTSVFPIADTSGTDNFACSVMLRERGVELRSVPMATPHVGMVSCPQVGDLVLVTFVGGDANSPIIVGRLHSEQHRPPVHEDAELVIEAPYGGETRLSFKPDGSVLVVSSDAECQIGPDNHIAITGQDLSITADGDVTLTGAGALSISIDGDAEIAVQGNCSLETTDCAIKASGNIDLGEGGSGVITETSHKCYFTGAPLVGSQSVKAKD